ncbi:hypothetical protein ACJQWK_03562 [Exserohilum turcicum]
MVALCTASGMERNTVTVLGSIRWICHACRPSRLPSEETVSPCLLYALPLHTARCPLPAARCPLSAAHPHPGSHRPSSIVHRPSSIPPPAAGAITAATPTPTPPSPPEARTRRHGVASIPRETLKVPPCRLAALLLLARLTCRLLLLFRLLLATP